MSENKTKPHCIQVSIENRRKGHCWEDFVINWMVILQWVQKWGRRLWAGFNWPRLGTSGGGLLQVQVSGFRAWREICWPAWRL